MRIDSWLKSVERIMRDKYGLELNDWKEKVCPADSKNYEPEEWVMWYGEKYDLTPIRDYDGNLARGLLGGMNGSNYINQF